MERRKKTGSTAAIYRLLVAVIPIAWSAPVKLIIDTDMSTDCDDVGALCVAHALADRGEAEIIAVVHNTGANHGVGAVSVINDYYGRSKIPVGAFHGTFGAELPGKYIDDLAANWPSDVKSIEEVPDAVSVYRAVLVAQPDHSVTIASIGFMGNLAALLHSNADSYSNMSGLDLVAAKVAHVVIMGGHYPSSKEHRAEWNFGGGGNATVAGDMAKRAIESIPPNVSVIFSGYEVGASIFSGGQLTDCADISSPCRQAYIDLQGLHKDRASWDPSVTLVAVRGVNASQYSEEGQGGKNQVDSSTGHNQWVYNTTEAGQQTFLVLLPDAHHVIGTQIDELLCQRPHAQHTASSAN